MPAPKQIQRDDETGFSPAYGLLEEVSRLVAYRYDLPETFDGLLVHLRRALHVDLLTLALPDEQKQSMVLRTSLATGVVRAEIPAELSFNDCPSGTAWLTQKIVKINDMTDDRRWPTVTKALRSSGIKTYWSVPLTAGDRRIGTLGVGSLRHDAFGDDELALLTQIAIPVAMAVENELIREHAERYRRDMIQAREHAARLAGMSSAIADQPTVKAVLHSLRGVLSSTCGLHGAELYVLSDDGDSLYSFAFDRDEDAPAIKIGAKILRIGAVAQALEEQKPVFVHDLGEEVLKHPDLAPFAREVAGRSAYLFPVSTSHKRYGVLSTPKLDGQFLPEDVELLRSLASHVAVALECALARDRAELYQRNATQERDRLKLLLDINNHIVTKLEANELFQAVARSMLTHFGQDATSFRLINKQSGLLELRYQDFPTGNGLLEKVNATVPDQMEKECWRLRKPQIYSLQSTELAGPIREAARAESLVSAVSVPLIGAEGPLGLLSMGSRKPDTFSETDFDLLSQIGTQISLALDNALAYGRLRRSHDDLEVQRLYLESEIHAEYNFEEMVGDSPAWRQVLHQIRTVAPTDAGVLLLGETGTGKELLARAIHSRSLRHDRSLVKLSCAAVPLGLLESELFGHEKGAFTGALTKQIGRFELANKGSLFLDEVGDIPLELQTKLLRALQEQEFERLGNPHTIKVDVRVIAATNCDLSQMVKDRTFRQDLFYRLNVFPIVVPPLRERAGDVELLVRHFVVKYASRMRKKIESIPAATMKALRNYDWPGNIRELEHFIERAVILSPADVLQVPVEELRGRTLEEKIPTLEQGEREQILQALRASGGMVGGPKGAATRLGINRSTLNSRMRKLGITRADIERLHEDTARSQLGAPGPIRPAGRHG